MFLFSLPPCSKSGLAHWTSAHPQRLLHHQRAGQEWCVYTQAAPQAWGAEDQRGRRGVFVTHSYVRPFFSGVKGFVWVITCHFDAVLPSKTMHFKQLERKVRLVCDLRGSGWSPAPSQLLLSGGLPRRQAPLTAPSLLRPGPGRPSTAWRVEHTLPTRSCCPFGWASCTPTKRPEKARCYEVSKDLPLEKGSIESTGEPAMGGTLVVSDGMFQRPHRPTERRCKLWGGTWKTSKVPCSNTSSSPRLCLLTLKGHCSNSLPFVA